MFLICFVCVDEAASYIYTACRTGVNPYVIKVQPKNIKFVIIWYSVFTLSEICIILLHDFLLWQTLTTAVRVYVRMAERVTTVSIGTLALVLPATPDRTVTPVSILCYVVLLLVSFCSRHWVSTSVLSLHSYIYNYMCVLMTRQQTVRKPISEWDYKLGDSLIATWSSEHLLFSYWRSPPIVFEMLKWVEHC